MEGHYIQELPALSVCELRSLELDREVLALLALILSFDSSNEDEKDHSRRVSSSSDCEATSKSLSFGVSHSPRAVSDFEGHRKLLWDINDAAAQTTVDSSVLSRRALEIFLSCTILSARSTAYSFPIF